VVCSEVLVFGKSLGIRNRWWNGMMLFGFLMLSLDMHSFSGLHSRMLLLLGSICVDGAIVVTVCVSFVVQVMRIETICSLNVA
jgi:hypothetical protein